MTARIAFLTALVRQAFLSTIGMAAAAVVSLGGNLASAAVRITDDYGGQIGAYIDHFETVRNAGERVVIDGPCMSACTLVLGIVPQERICVTPRARLGFHAAWRTGAGSRKVAAEDGTQLLMEIYPEHIRSWIIQRGGLSPQIKYLRGQELMTMYPFCP